MRRLGFVFFSIVLGVLFTAVAVELLVRLLYGNGMQYDIEMWKYARYGKQVSDNPLIGHEHVPGASFRAMSVDVSINAHGMRDAEIGVRKPSGIFRVMMLGDSITFGWGVPVEKTVSELLEKKLNATGIASEFLNTGIGNTNTVMQVERFLERERRFQPDLVILDYFLNDAEDIPEYRTSGFLARHSYAWTYLGARFDVLLRMLSAREGWRDYYSRLYGEGGHWKAASEAIDRLAQYCKSNQIDLMIVNYPELRQLKDYPFTAATEKVRAAAARNGVPFLDLLPAVENEDPATLWVSRPDPHPNGRANALFADALYAALKRENLLPDADGNR